MSARRVQTIQRANERAAGHARVIIRAALFLAVTLLNGPFNAGLVGGGEDNASVHQILGLCLWGVIIVSCGFLPRIRTMDWSTGLYINFCFFGFTLASVLWSRTIGDSMMKAGALLVTLIGAWRLVLTFPVEEVIATVQKGFFALCLVSAGLALLAPSIGVETSYMHNGQWNGVFVNKQNLGVVSAISLYYSIYIYLLGADRTYAWISIVTTALCIIGSGSRGGGALAVMAILSITTMRRSDAFARICAFMPFFMALCGAALISYLLYTENRYLVVFGNNLDFTSRTLIWQHALRYFWESPWLGKGVNGFWTQSAVKDTFVERYKWFLDNYHDGYIAIVMESGIVGYALFLASYWFFALRASQVLGRATHGKENLLFSISYTFLIFFINFTETLFVRSTGFSYTMLMMTSAYVFCRAGPSLYPRAHAVAPAGRMARRLSAAAGQT
jgi:exopolysaccharide production protein ExoQ